MSRNREELGVVLSVLMREKRMKASDLARKIGVSRAAISQWVSGTVQHPDYGHLLKCAEALKLEPEEKKRLLQSAGYHALVQQSGGAQTVAVIDDTPLMPLTTRPIPHPRLFFGCTQLLEEIFAAWKRPVFEHIAVMGEKRSGKTSLLHYLKDIHHATQLRTGQRQEWFCEPYRWAYIRVVPK